jgi:hypothetical protein
MQYEASLCIPHRLRHYGTTVLPASYHDGPCLPKFHAMADMCGLASR